MPIKQRPFSRSLMNNLHETISIQGANRLGRAAINTDLLAASGSFEGRLCAHPSLEQTA
jgi:hypothetical protein